MKIYFGARLSVLWIQNLIYAFSVIVLFFLLNHVFIFQYVAVGHHISTLVSVLSRSPGQKKKKGNSNDHTKILLKMGKISPVLYSQVPTLNVLAWNLVSRTNSNKPKAARLRIKISPDRDTTSRIGFSPDCLPSVCPPTTVRKTEKVVSSSFYFWDPFELRRFAKALGSYTSNAQLVNRILSRVIERISTAQKRFHEEVCDSRFQGREE